MRFEQGQRWASKWNSNLFAEVVELFDEGRSAVLQLWDASGQLLEEGERVVYAQFAAHWNLLTEAC